MVSKQNHHEPDAPPADLTQRKPATGDLPDATGTWVVDTNVILVANGQHQGVDAASTEVCARWLEALMQTGRLALDDRHEIIGEYLHKTHASDGAGVGDAFLRWVLHNQDNPARIDLVSVEPDARRGYVAFPDDPRLARFDASDRKFVAVARSHPECPAIWQATDSKWLDWAPALADHGVQVRFLCTSVVAAFHRHKFGF
ncbi:MAG TPA: hypothetical protein VFM48_08825 [Aquabacterium sp.]|nr:hypothetical protein [Aquabacterium sp.]